MAGELRKRSTLKATLFGILATGAVGYGAWYELAGVKPVAASAQSASTQAAAKIPVTSFEVKKADFPVHVYGLGVVSPFKTVTVKSRVDGQITKVFFKQGQMVKEGDPLLEIDQRPFTAALEQAIAKKAAGRGEPEERPVEPASVFKRSQNNNSRPRKISIRSRPWSIR